MTIQMFSKMKTAKYYAKPCSSGFYHEATISLPNFKMADSLCVYVFNAVMDLVENALSLKTGAVGMS